MPRRDVWIAMVLTVFTILVIARMVPAHAEDTSDDTAYPYGTPTETFFIETPFPTMTEMAIPDNPVDADPTEPPLPEATPTETPTPADTPAPTESPTPAGLDQATLAATPMPEPSAPDKPREYAEPPLAAPMTLTMTASDTPLRCEAHQTVVIQGYTKPLTMLLLRFDDRIVGGGMSDESGIYAIPLHMGTEKTGTHTLQIVARQNGRHIQQVTCDTP